VARTIGRIGLVVSFVAIGGCKSDSTQPGNNAISVSVATASTSLEVNQSVTVTATIKDANGAPLTDRTVTWASSNISIATVVADAITAPSGTQTAQVQAIAPGSVTISATVSGGSGTLALTVVAGTAQRPQAFIRSAQGAMVAITELSGVTSSYASAINDVGQVVGSIHIGSVDHAFIWSAASGMVDIGVLPGFVHSSAGWINNSGVVVGWSSTASGSVSHAFRWSATTGMTDLGVLAGTDESFAYGINSAGQIVGETYTIATTIRRPFRWTEAKGMEDIGALTGDPAGGAYSVNDDGSIVGFSTTAAYRSGPVRAIQWTPAGVKTMISDCSGSPCYAAANGINKSGQVAGTRQNVGFVWTAAGGPVDLAGLPGAQFTEATALNDAGQVIGYSHIALNYRSFLWTPAAGFVDLGLLPGKTWTVATAINNLGQIVGYGQ